MARAAALFSLATVLSRIVGLLREVLVAYVFGVRGAINQFTSPRRSRRRPLAGRRRGARRGVHPGFNELLERGRSAGLRRRLDRRELSSFGLSSITVLTDGVRGAAARACTPRRRVPHLTVQLMWILMPTVVLLGFAGIVQAVANSWASFFVPAIAPVLWNVVIALGLVAVAIVDDRALAGAPRRRCSARSSRCCSRCSASAASRAGCGWRLRLARRRGAPGVHPR